jgi:hypothetical protein
MEMSSAAKSKKIRDYAAAVLPALLGMRKPAESWEDLVGWSWFLGEKMYEKEVETYDRIMAEASSTLPRGPELSVLEARASGESVTVARRGNTRDV